MATDSVIRSENFRRYCADHRPPLTAAELVRRLGSTNSLWADLLAGRKQSFGEKLARRIEAGLGLPRLYLDRPAAGRHVALPDDALPSLLDLRDIMAHAPAEQRRAIANEIRLAILQARDRYTGKLGAMLDELDSIECPERPSAL